MGYRDREYYRELDECKYIIDGIGGLVFTLKDENHINSIDITINMLHEIKMIFSGIYNSQINIDKNIYYLIINDLGIIYKELRDVINIEKKDDQFYNKIDDLIERLNMVLKEIISLRNYYPIHFFEDDRAYNSMNFYNTRIKDIEKEKVELENIINKLIEEDQTSEEQLKELKLKKAKLENAIIQIETYKKELELRKKQDDAIKEWENKIRNTFNRLTEYLEPVENEHKRLKNMFFIYGFVACFILLIIISIEFISCRKIYISPTFPEFKNYIILFLPIPIAGGLLWALVCQMNRAQRQLVILSKYIHEIKYIEGLLLSINSLSSSIENAVERINSALDKMISNHLNIQTNNIFCEEEIIKEEKKDGMPYDVLMKILSAIKDITK